MDLVVVADDEWAKHVADRFLRRLVERPDLRMCLPTGNTPVPAYREFADAGGSMGAATIFLLDEFVLPPGSPGRCDTMIRRDLLSHLEQPPAHLIEWDTTGDLDTESDRMEREIAQRGGLDLTVLGLGANGHLGTNEPGSPIDSRCSAVELAPETAAGAARYGATQTPSLGLTMGVGTLLESEEIWLLVTGSHKAGLLARTLGDPVSADFPATYLRTHSDTTVIADESAASAL